MKPGCIWRTLRGAVCLLVALYMLVPIAIVVVISFSSGQFLSFPPPGFSLQWYRALNDPAWTSSLATSVEVMIPAALLSTCLSLGAALMLRREGLPGAPLIRGILLSPLVIPVIITGAAFYSVFRPLGLHGTVLGLIVAHTVLCIPYALTTITSSLAMVDWRIAQASASLGARPFTTFRRVTFPSISSGVISSFLFSLVVSFDEVVVSMFVSGPDARPVTVQMWSNIRGDVDPTIAALASVLFVFALLILLLEAIFGRGEATEQ
ncbi:ABC transporter permease [Paraburkholderia sp. Ac-20336]|uniref:ABC transporter permease n=1 Tax=Paraburkholderia sp. Ac-20336 TaxID=2703886 RepID=UPI00197FBE89|nr:ABC transporter permease [Paraburkholderia sp. Ac-20336]MBN3801715.1 ABC transporter permease [Paraburkholderia sp. Ac-20336]